MYIVTPNNNPRIVKIYREISDIPNLEQIVMTSGRLGPYVTGHSLAEVFLKPTETDILYRCSGYNLYNDVLIKDDQLFFQVDIEKDLYTFFRCHRKEEGIFQDETLIILRRKWPKTGEKICSAVEILNRLLSNLAVAPAKPKLPFDPKLN